MTKLDILVVAAHPDDAELSCSGTILKMIHFGKRVGIVDLTKGELGTRGDIYTRAEEAQDSAEILGVHARENLGLADGFFINDKESQLKLIQIIRKYQPEIILTNALEDRHPDHGKAARFVADTSFLSGLVKIETQNDHVLQMAWRPKYVYHFIQDRLTQPDFVVDISAFWEKKMASILAYRTQFYSKDLGGLETYISSPLYLKYIEARSTTFGHMIGVAHGEGFKSERMIGVTNIFDLI